MIEYLKELAARFRLAADASIAGGGHRIQGNPPINSPSLFKAFAYELDRFDPRDFESSVRAAFVELRSDIRHLADGGATSDEIRARYANNIIPILELYRGEGSGTVARDFSFVNDARVRVIVERDYKELKLRAFPDGAWKSTVILCGGILEAILYDRLTKDAAAAAAAMASNSAPKRSKAIVKDITKTGRKDEWSLSDLIKVAADLGIISKSNEASVDEVLREYRNYVHARVEVEKGVSVSEGHAMASLGSLEVIIDKM